MLPEPEKGRMTRKSTSSGGIPRNPKKGLKNVEMIVERPLILKSSTAINIATRYGNVEIQRSTELLAPEIKWS